LREPSTLAKNTKNRAASQQLAHMPTVFVQNDGQWDPSVRFGAHGHGASLSFTDRGMVLGLRGKDEAGEPARESIALDFVRDGVKCSPKGEQPLPGKHNYFLGNDPAKWHTNVPLFGEVRYDEIAPGVALVVSDRAGKLEYDLHVERGADLGQVAIQTEGVESLTRRDDGALVMQTAIGSFEQRPPKAWYELTTGEKKLVECSFKVTSATTYGFEVPNLERDARLTVDPILDWSTYFGGGNGDRILAVDYDSGLVTIAGFTESSSPSDIPLPPSTQTVLQRTQADGGGTYDGFGARLDLSQSGSSQLVWSTYLGGTDLDEATGVAVDASGNVSVCGFTTTPYDDFPVTSTAYQAHFSNPFFGSAAYVSYLRSDGAALLYSTYFGSGSEGANALAIDSSPTITIAGSTSSGTLPTTSTAYDTTYDGGGDGFIATFDPNQSGSSSLVYSSYLGGGTGAGNLEQPLSVARESSFVYIAGYALGPASGYRIATTSNAFQGTKPGYADGFLVQLDMSKSGSAQNVYSSYLGGSTSDDWINAIVVHNGIIYGTGYSESTDFPTTTYSPTGAEATAWSTNLTGLQDVVVFKLNPTVSSSVQLRYSTYLGGGGLVAEWGNGIGRVTDRSVVVVGFTESTTFPTTTNGVSTTLSGGSDAFVARLNWANHRAPSVQLDYSTFLGGSGGDVARCMAMNGSSIVYVSGSTTSTDYPTAGSPLQSVLAGGSGDEDGVVCRFNLPVQN
jgi:hypothetical protein